LRHTVLEIGAYTNEPTDDYPDFAMAVAERISRKKAKRGILICGSGVGACIAANKFPEYGLQSVMTRFPHDRALR